MNLPVDHQARDQALDSLRSVIIQAPAGSGKTGLLIRRYLKLLAESEEPEQILCITFTRKATAEVRKRVIETLKDCECGDARDDDSELLRLSNAVLTNDREKGWDLVNNIRRLRIQTIDSLCSELVQRMPWSARFGAPPSIVENAELLYREAAKSALAHLDDNDNEKLSAACNRVMTLLDANLGAGIDLLAGMLHKRDKWMRLLVGHSRELLESWWQQTISDTLVQCSSMFDNQVRQELQELAPFAAHNIILRNRAQKKPASKLEACVSMRKFPEPEYQALPQWQGIAELLLLGNRKGIRKTVDVRSGFPPSQPDFKRRMLELLESLRQNAALEQALIWVSILPDPSYSDDQWRTLEAILKLLPVAAAELKILFSESNQADYIELAQRAELALGDKTAPSDLALVFDYQLKHILVDEFQDTSAGQIGLLEKLLEGWQPGDGRTAFFVGDPMQSIYRFREAEVANFLHTQSHGIGDVVPLSLVLHANFRSDPAIVKWINHTFSDIMPASRSDEIHGAVSYASAEPSLKTLPGCEVALHPAVNGSVESEAECVADLVSRLIEQYPEDTIAVLGRTRISLSGIASALESQGLPFQGIKLQKLSERQAIQDLFNLACAIQQPSDRTAWLGLMRAPWCGFDLNQMMLVCGDDISIPVLRNWLDFKDLGALSVESQRNLRKLQNELGQSLLRRGVVPLWKNLEATWIALGGPACVAPSELEDCQRLISLVRQLEDDGKRVNKNTLKLAVRELWSSTDIPRQVQLLTIHAAKGLEFDTVILPGLERQARSTEPELLRFHNLPDRLLLAPRPPSGNKDDPFYHYLGQLEKEHQHNELIRLLYVACTRARSRLHLFGNINTNSKGELRQPASSSMLSLLWKNVQYEFENVDKEVPGCAENDSQAETDPDCFIERLPCDWQPPAIPSAVLIETAAPESDSESDAPIEFDWAGETARICGVVIHRILQHVDRTGWAQWRRQPVEDQAKDRWRSQLVQAGISRDEMDEAIQIVQDAVTRTRSDPNAAWIFSSTHQDVRTEWPVTGFIDDRIRHCVIDRGFVDQDGSRWIIDFKSSRHEQAQDLEQFMRQEKERYRLKMERYAKVVAKLDGRPVRKALYYPILQRFEEL